jgi:hypothetical protein
MLLRMAKSAVFLLASTFPAIPTWAEAPKYQTSHQCLNVEGVSPQCPMIYDNDWWTDVPDAAYIWAKASLGKCQLRGNIITRCTFGWEKGYAHKMEEQIQDCRKLLKAARASGLRNIPDPVLGAEEALRRPASGGIEETRFKRSKGSDLIVAEALRATPEKPLLVFVGGSCTTVASAYLTEPGIAGRMIVFQVDGGTYNGSDGWAWEITMKRCRFANWARGYFWDKLNAWNPERFRSLPSNPLGDLLRHYARSNLARANQWGDGAWIFYTFDRRCLVRAEDYDRKAITIPRDATQVKYIAAEFFATMNDPAVYGNERDEPARPVPGVRDGIHRALDRLSRGVDFGPRITDSPARDPGLVQTAFLEAAQALPENDGLGLGNLGGIQSTLDQLDGLVEAAGAGIAGGQKVQPLRILPRR